MTALWQLIGFSPRAENASTMTRCYLLLITALPAVLIGSRLTRAQAPATSPAYQIVLRSRHAQVTPAKCGRAQTGGGSILVAQPEPNTIIVTMSGSAVVGSGYRPANATIHYDFAQDLDILPLRDAVRPPRLGMIGHVVGTLQVTDQDRVPCDEGVAAQGPATANLMMGGVNLLCVGTEPSTVGHGQEVAINHQCGPVETSAVASPAGCGYFRLTATFDIGANQGKGVFCRRFAVADFDPTPQLDAFWADALKPFRSVPRDDFGFKLILRVVEDAAVKTAATN